MRRRIRAVTWGLVLAGVVAGASHPESWSAPGGLTGLSRTRTADTIGRGVFELGAFSSVHTLDDPNLNRHTFWVHQLQLNIGTSPHLELGAMLPLQSRWIDRRDGSTGTASTTGVGDMVVGGKLRLPLPGRFVRFGAFTLVSLPTGSRSRGFTSNTTDFEISGAMTIDLSTIETFVPMRLHLGGGYRWNQNEVDGLAANSLTDVAAGGFWPPSYPAVPLGEGPKWNDHVPVRAAIEFNTRVVDLFTEFSADLLLGIDRLRFDDNFVFITQGAVVKFRSGFNLKAAADVSLQRDDVDPVVLESPDWRLTLGILWRSSLSLGDHDQDGVPNKKDACPDEAEDFDGFEDDDGCPDNDNDQDGIADRDDLAPDLPEDFDGFEDGDGRPDLDNDGDGIPDERDQCPNEPEDFDGDRDLDGCPDTAPPPVPAPEKKDEKPPDGQPQDAKPENAKPPSEKPPGEKPKP